jgi:DNA-directed RNA polymerase specialized sigma54-like protein
MGVTIQEVADATRVISALEPRPGRAFGGEDPVYISPDIYVYKLGDEFHVLLNEDGLPKLRISSVYREMLSRRQSRGDGQKDTRAYVHEKVRSAMWLIKSIHQRQRTIYKVMQSIIQHQRDFFEHGVAHLKPLNLRDVADDIEMHESTVSRVTTQQVRPHAAGASSSSSTSSTRASIASTARPSRASRSRRRSARSSRARIPRGRCRTSGSPRCSRRPTSTSPGGR